MASPDFSEKVGLLSGLFEPGDEGCTNPASSTASTSFPGTRVSAALSELSVMLRPLLHVGPFLMKEGISVEM